MVTDLAFKSETLREEGSTVSFWFLQKGLKIGNWPKQQIVKWVKRVK